MIIPAFWSSPWRLPAVASAVVRWWNTVSDTAGQDTVAAYAISRPIRWSLLLWWSLLLCGIQRRIHRHRRFRYAKWVTVEFSLPIMPNIFLLRIYCLRPHCPAYPILFLSSVSLFVLHLFCCPNCLTSLPRLYCWYLDRLTPPPHASASRLCFTSPLHVSATQIHLMSPSHVSDLRLRRHLRCHPYPQSLSSIVSD